jgi:hypothetical protein
MRCLKICDDTFSSFTKNIFGLSDVLSLCFLVKITHWLVPAAAAATAASDMLDMHSRLDTRQPTCRLGIRNQLALRNSLECRKVRKICQAPERY